MSKHELPAKTIDVTAELNVTDQLIHLLLKVVNDCVTYSIKMVYTYYTVGIKGS